MARLIGKPCLADIVSVEETVLIPTEKTGESYHKRTL